MHSKPTERKALKPIQPHYRGTKMEIMIILTIALLGLVAINEVTDH